MYLSEQNLHIHAHAADRQTDPFCQKCNRIFTLFTGHFLNHTVKFLDFQPLDFLPGSQWLPSILLSYLNLFANKLLLLLRCNAAQNTDDFQTNDALATKNKCILITS